MVSSQSGFLSFIVYVIAMRLLQYHSCSIIDLWHSISENTLRRYKFLFDGCINLRQLKLPEQLKTLWGYTFVRCGIEEIVLPDQLRIIPPFAFKDCRNLRKVVCGAGLEKIYAWAFGGCDLLTEDGLIHGPKVEISPQAFERH